MLESPPVLPEAIDLERTRFEEHARDRADRALRLGVPLFSFDLFLVVATFALAFFLSKPMDPWVVWMLIASLPLSVVLAGVMWLPARLHRKHYTCKVRSTWTLACRDTKHHWRIEGIGPASAWRDITVECKELPRNKDKLIGSPKLHVRIDNEQGVLKRGNLLRDGENTSLFVIDKQGLPIAITIEQADPKHASEEEPWVVEISLFGDADTLETLLAWPVASPSSAAGGGEASAEINRQA